MRTQGPARRARLALFLGCAVVLLTAALLLSSGGPPTAPRPPWSLPSAPAPRRPSRPPAEGDLAEDARRFLRAFLAYEVGGMSSQIEHALRASATPAFSAELLAAPPRPARRLRRARIISLSTHLLSSRPPEALVSGSAGRPGGREQFSFLFARPGQRWLAAGAGE